MLKREDTLALTCSLMYLYGSSMLSILITDSFLTSTPNPIGKKQNTGKGEQHSTWHRCNAHTRMMTWQCLKNCIWTLEHGDQFKRGREGINPNLGTEPRYIWEGCIEHLKCTMVQVVQWCMNLMPKDRSHFSENFGILFIFFWFKMN